MANIYDIRRYGKLTFLVTAAIVVAVFLYVSNNLVKDLSAQERDRMEIWAEATKEIVNAFDTEEPAGDTGTDINFLLSIIERNTTIPVLITNDEGKILNHRNFELPEPVTSIDIDDLSDANREFLYGKLEKLRTSTNVIDISIAPGADQHLYYEDSTLLKRLSYYPYVQLLVMIVFIAVVYFAVLSTKKAEQNKVWVGLSKETAHQLGTPISSLMAWMELLPDIGVDIDTVGEMNKDVQRLSTIASRFSKIGSVPQMEKTDINAIVGHSTSYMSSRISPSITLSSRIASNPIYVMSCSPLFEWVMENLIKNAVDAMEGHGSLTVSTDNDRGKAVIEVTDTGKGIARKNFRNVFNPGYTTKKRGWGLGLTLAKRIVEEYHSGRIFVKSSVPGVGTTFRIELPVYRQA